MKRFMFSRSYLVHRAVLSLIVLAVIAAFLIPGSSPLAKNPYKRAFFSTYPVAAGTAIDEVPSNPGHCGVCHFDFGGSDTRNPYGLSLEVGLANGMTIEEAILSVDGDDADGDGFSNNTEITDLVNFTNTSTFPGLTIDNYTLTWNVDHADILPHLTPAGATDTIPPTVTVHDPMGGEVLQAGTFHSIQYTAEDLESGLSHIDIYLSDDSGVDWFKTVAADEPPGTGFSWFVPNFPGTFSRIRVEAHDNAGNEGSGMSMGDFTITATPAGFVPSTMRDMELPGTEPFHGAVLEDPDISCATCHGNYDLAVEPWHNWRGSMMAQAMRDPMFLACLAVAEQDAPSVGDLCIRCHSPGGWQEGRSIDTSGDMINPKDRHSVHCDFCHREVDQNYVPGVSPPTDEEILSQIEPLPLAYANGQFITDPAPLRRGPRADAEAAHQFVESPLHRSSDMCGKCHDVSNPVFIHAGGADYVPNDFDAEHPDMDLRNMFPIERTYSEWSQSEYAATGVYAPQFAGNNPTGMVSECQDCHMRDVLGKAASSNGVNDRADLKFHDFTGGNTFIPAMVADFYPDEVDLTQLQEAEERARYMLRNAATMTVTSEDFGITVRVQNETAHKLPSGYPEGRRIWLNVVAKDINGVQVFESGAYDWDTADLTHDAQAKIYEIQPGLSPGLADALGLPSGKSFHFVLNDTIYSDNRIPPRGFTNAAFEAIQSPAVAHPYEDGQFWDDTPYSLPVDADSVIVTLYYQLTSKEYVEFLRDENVTNNAGQAYYDAWVAHGKSAPELMVQVREKVNVISTDDEIAGTPLIYNLEQNFPNPFNPVTRIDYSIAERSHVYIAAYDVAGRRVSVIVNEEQEPSRYSVTWNGTDSAGRTLASGIYFIRYRAGGYTFTRKAVLLR
jgi:hypothetical protein